ncbi:MAG: hypothetical protein Q9182_004354 [Xanthomendoza sp. 2 TL-2023]
MAPPPSNSTTTILTAHYTSPTTGSRTFTHPLATSTTSSLAEKTAYLSTLRASVTQLQSDINEFLTSKMDEDKALAAKTGLSEKVDENKEEDFYGEEVVQDEDGGG